MKRLFLAILFLFFTCLYAYGDTEVVGGGGGVSENTNVTFDNISANRVILKDSGSAAAPSISVASGSTGIYSSAANTIGFTAGTIGVSRISNSFIIASIGGTNAGIRNITATATNPPIVPSIGDADTGVGRAGDDQLSLIAGGVEGIRIGAGGSVESKGAVAFSGISTVTVDYVIGNFVDDPTWFIECDATLGNISTTLPPVADKKGRLLGVKLMSAANGCYLDGNGVETIDGAAGQTITTRYNVINLIAGSSEWLIGW